MIAALRALVLGSFDSLQWRHHGIGCLQAYLRELAEPEVRVHAWDPRLVRLGISGMGDVHDHRFDMESTVLVGALSEVYFGEPIPDPDGPWWVYHVENARSAGAERGFDGECAPVSRERYRAVGTQVLHREGETYRQRRATFHATHPCELAVTLVVMHEKRGSARLLVPWGHEPVHAFGESAPAALQAVILRDARRLLEARRIGGRTPEVSR